MGKNCCLCRRNMRDGIIPSTCRCFQEIGNDGYLLYDNEGYCTSCWKRLFRLPMIAKCCNKRTDTCPYCNSQMEMDKYQLFDA